MGLSRDFIKNVNSPFMYAKSVLGAALISVGHCYGSWPVPAYLTLMHLLGKISLWAGEQILLTCVFALSTKQELSLGETACPLVFTSGFYVL
jgi:hypothetical protein